jgi:hypothetical protein
MPLFQFPLKLGPYYITMNKYYITKTAQTIANKYSNSISASSSALVRPMYYVVKSNYSYGKRDVVGSNTLKSKAFTNEFKAIEYMALLVKKDGINGKYDPSRYTYFVAKDHLSDFGDAGEGYLSHRKKCGLSNLEKVAFEDDYFEEENSKK